MIYLAADHRGFALKEKTKQWLTEWGYEFQDVGAPLHDPEDDYPDFMHAAARNVAENPLEHRAILFGGSGQGEAMVANRYRGVRAIVYYGGPKEIVAISRVHNDSNVLSIGAALGINQKEEQPMDDITAQTAIKLWLETKYSGEEGHARRIAKIELPASE